MKRKSLLAIIVFAVALLPSLATAAVIMNNPVTVHTGTSQTNPVYLAQGPGYSTANQLGYLALVGNGATTTGGQSLYLNGTPGTGSTVLVNALEVVNASSSAFKGSVMMYVNGTIPTGVEVLYSSSPMSYNGQNVVGGTLLQTGNPVHITTSKLYVSIVMDGSLTNGLSEKLTMQMVYT